MNKRHGASLDRIHPGMSRMTVRECEILALMSQGLDNKDIALKLCIDEISVRLHLRGVYLKLGTKNRAQAIQSSGMLANSNCRIDAR